MTRLPLLLVLLCIVGLLAVSAPAFAQLRFGLISAANTNYAQGVMGGASAEGSGITRQATTDDNVVIYRAFAPPPLVCLPMLTAQFVPGYGVILPAHSPGEPADAGRSRPGSFRAGRDGAESDPLVGDRVSGKVWPDS